MTRTTSPRDPDAILAAWLEEGPNQLPDTTRRAIAVGLRSTSQTRRALRVPRRYNAMNPFARFAVAAAAIVIVAGGALYLLSPSNQGVGGPPAASPSPSATSAVAPSITPGASASSSAWKTFYASSSPFRMEVPAGWVHSVPVDDDRANFFAGEEAQYMDRLAQPVLGTPYLVVSVFRPRSESVAAWMERNVTRLVADCDAGDPIEISIGGTTGERRSASCTAGLATEYVFFVIADHPIIIESSAASADAATATQILDHVIDTFMIT
jgi:hypothetical protein